jgi:hypothetical protein
MLKVLKTTKSFLPEIIDITFDKDVINRLSENVSEKDLRISEISLAKNKWGKDLLVELTFLFNTINFCFWAKPQEKKWTIQDDNLDGAVALFRCLENEFTMNSDLLNPAKLAGTNENDLKRILKGNTVIPLMSERLSSIHNFGRVIEQKFHNSIKSLLEVSNYDAYKLAELLVDNFPCFDDTSAVNGLTVAFYKRAQLNSKMIHDVLVSFGEEGLKNIEKLTAFADYKIPQILRNMGILEYSDKLANKIDNFELIEVNSFEEVEIRTATVWAVEYMKEAIKQKYGFVTSSHIDNMLWLKSQGDAKGKKPYHRTLTTAY